MKKPNPNQAAGMIHSERWFRLSDYEEEEGVCCSDERLATRLWQEILRNKGLPSNTPYVFIHEDDYLYKNIPKDEDFCDRLMREIRAKRESTKTASTSEYSPHEDIDKESESEKKTKKKRDKKKKKDMKKAAQEDANNQLTINNRFYSLGFC